MDIMRESNPNFKGQEAEHSVLLTCFISWKPPKMLLHLDCNGQCYPAFLNIHYSVYVGCLLFRMNNHTGISCCHIGTQDAAVFVQSAKRVQNSARYWQQLWWVIGKAGHLHPAKWFSVLWYFGSHILVPYIQIYHITGKPVSQNNNHIGCSRLGHFILLGVLCFYSQKGTQILGTEEIKCKYCCYIF